MVVKLVSVVALIAIIFAIWLPEMEAVPAYPGSTFNSWDTQPPPPQQQQQRRILPGQKRTFQGVVRQHMDDLDKQTQSDLKIIGYLENELNKIFSCYIKLSCPRTRSPKVLSECEEIKDWPLYHQVMKMAGIKKYPYQSYAPFPSPSRLLATTELPDMNLDEEITTTDDINGLASIDVDDGADDDSHDIMLRYQQPQINRQRAMRRVRRGQKHQHHNHQHHIHGAPVTSDDAQ